MTLYHLIFKRPFWHKRPIRYYSEKVEATLHPLLLSYCNNDDQEPSPPWRFRKYIHELSIRNKGTSTKLKIIFLFSSLSHNQRSARGLFSCRAALQWVVRWQITKVTAFLGWQAQLETDVCKHKLIFLSESERDTCKTGYTTKFIWWLRLITNKLWSGWRHVYHCAFPADNTLMRMRAHLDAALLPVYLSRTGEQATVGEGRTVFCIC